MSSLNAIKSSSVWPPSQFLTAKEEPRARNVLDEAHKKVGTPYLYGGNTDDGIDCSHFVHQVYNAAGIQYPYLPTSADWKKAGFQETENPRRGDIIMWDGHMGIVADPEKKIFIGAQSSTGVAEAGYEEGKYWGKKPHHFLTHEN